MDACPGGVVTSEQLAKHTIWAPKRACVGLAVCRWPGMMAGWAKNHRTAYREADREISDGSQ